MKNVDVEEFVNRIMINSRHICRNRLRRCLKRIRILNCQGLQCQEFSISDFFESSIS